MSYIEQLFENNRNWADKINQEDPTFFDTLSKQQSPEYLWIGCSDSRVPANQLLGLMPGEIFVHRNIANQVVHTDINCLSVIQFAVEYLKVKHIIVCGHYGCGGVQASLDDKSYGLMDNWLRHLEDVQRMHMEELNAVSDPQQKWDLLCELNVVEQVANVSKTTAVIDAWKRNQELTVHGLVYKLTDGLLRNLNVTVSNETYQSDTLKFHTKSSSK
ncbi:carbonate dehydratase [Thalassotalea marina]|nr:carbonate dehydratase [Thalassotalea marina]